DRRELDEPGKARLPRHADGDHAALHRMPLDEVRQGGLDERFLVIAGIGENVLVLNEFEVVNLELIAVADELDGFQRPVADINPPGEAGGCHVVSPRIGGGPSGGIGPLPRVLVLWCNLNLYLVQQAFWVPTSEPPFSRLRYSGGGLGWGHSTR